MPAILYSFRRCPYAMRARLAISVSQTAIKLREIVLKHKPPEMLTISPKGTVPVLQLADGQVIDESFDIMLWALKQNDPKAWLAPNFEQMLLLVKTNDEQFKPLLDKYKYAMRFPEHSEQEYRQQGEVFLQQIEQQLSQSPYLMGEQQSLADMALLPFIRQFASVDLQWFEQAPYPHLQAWLKQFIDSALFRSIMQKHPSWLESACEIDFP